MADFVVGAKLYLALVLVLASVLKALSGQYAAGALRSFLPKRIVQHGRKPIVRLVWLAVVAEVALALGLVLTVGWIAHLVAALALVTFAVFLLVVLAASRKHVPCGCFGSLSERPADVRDVLRGALMLGVASAAFFLQIGVGVPNQRSIGGVIAAVLLLAVTAVVSFISPSRHVASGLTEEGSRKLTGVLDKDDEIYRMDASAEALQSAHRTEEGGSPIKLTGTPRRLFLRRVAALGVSLVGATGLGVLPFSSLSRSVRASREGVTQEEVMSQLRSVTGSERSIWIDAARRSSDLNAVLREIDVPGGVVDWTRAKVWAPKEQFVGADGAEWKSSSEVRIVDVSPPVSDEGLTPIILWFGDDSRDSEMGLASAHGAFGRVVSQDGRLSPRWAHSSKAVTAEPVTFVAQCQEDVLGPASCQPVGCAIWNGLCQFFCGPTCLCDCQYEHCCRNSQRLCCDKWPCIIDPSCPR